MSFPPYPKYKPSGVEWLGEVPEHWEIKKIRYLALLKSGENITSEQIEETGEYPVFGGNGIRGYSSRFTHHGHYVLIGRQGALCGNVNYASGKFLASEHAVVVSPLTEFATVWIGELLRAMDLNQYSVSAAQPGLSVDKISALKIPVPPIPEQRAIADFLDRETARLDTLVAKKRELIEKLKEKRTALISRTVTRGLPPEAARAAGLDPQPKLKPSGIEWLGEVPEHWEESKIKFEATVVSKGTTPSTLEKQLIDVGIRFIKAENIQDGKVFPFPEFFVDTETDQLLARSRLKEQDVLVVIAGATTGKVAVLPTALLPANTNQAVCFIRLRSTTYAPILSAWISTKFVQDIVWNSAVQAAQPNLAMEDIKTIPCLIPPLPEQHAIADYLDRETAKIDQMAAKVEEAVLRLQEYRTALITAAVTGKIEVREFKNAEGVQHQSRG